MSLRLTDAARSLLAANEWEIVRLGADIGLRSHGCDRKVMLVRSEFDRRFRGFIERHGAE